MSELAASLEMPSLSCNPFHRIQTEVGSILKNSAFDEMKKAGDEERKMALECGNVDSDGIPMCTVVADGQWSKRSYKTKYDALSGVVRMYYIKDIQKKNYDRLKMIKQVILVI